MRKLFFGFLVLIYGFIYSSPALTADSSTGAGMGSEKSTDSTNLDFDSALIDGHMKAPSGFFLQGRNKQSLSNMVRLRANFREHLRNSKTAVKAIVH